MDGAGGHRGRVAVPVDQSAWAGAGGPVVRYRRGARREEAGGTGWTRSLQIRRPQSTGWARYQCGHCRGVGAVDYEPDGPPISAVGAAIYSRWLIVPKEQRGQVGTMESAKRRSRRRERRNIRLSVHTRVRPVRQKPSKRPRPSKSRQGPLVELRFQTSTCFSSIDKTKQVLSCPVMFCQDV